VLWGISLCLTLPPRALIPIKPAPLKLYPSCKALVHNFWRIWRGHYQCWADIIRFFQYPLVVAIRQFISTCSSYYYYYYYFKNCL
jgi:hypothetical protein